MSITSCASRRKIKAASDGEYNPIHMGLPRKDTDKDGVPDLSDKCPTVAGVLKYDGCPVPDSDGDGIDDETDKCPNDPGPAVSNGCPPRDRAVFGSAPPEPPPPPPPPSVTAGSAPLGSGRRPANVTVTDNAPEQAKPQASFVYGYKNNVKVGESFQLRVDVKLDKPLADLVQMVGKSMNPAEEGKKTDTSVIRSLILEGEKYFEITPDYDHSVFKIEMGPGTALQRELMPNQVIRWTWRVEALKPDPSSTISIVIRAKGEKGDWYDVEQGVVYLNVAVEAEKNNSSISSASLIVVPQTTWEKYKWPFLGLMVVVPFALIVLRRRKRFTSPAKRIFFSYAWGGQGETVVDEMYKCLKGDGLNVVRDKVNLQYKGHISSFMRDIGTGKFVIVILSDKYLRSRFCMFELYEIYRNSSLDKETFMRKVFPVRIEDINLGDPLVVAKYTQYWEEEAAKCLRKVQEGDVSPEEYAQYEVVKKIENEAGNLLYFLSDINALDLAQLAIDDFKALKTALHTAIEAQDKN
ncbi:MAG: GTPase family domain [Segetibacter sp.]|nr:GTPase family domain [Segetibacter sp.]